MRFLVPIGGDVSGSFGVLTSPGHNGIPKGIYDGLPWAADNQAFTQGFDPDHYFRWLEKMEPYRDTCLFVVVPDVVGDAIQTLDNFRYWLPYFIDWPIAFAAQDGQENLSLPPYFDTLFIGGSTEWKESQAAINVIKRAQSMRKHIHIGRVNWGRRYRLFSILRGADNFTCDGTRPRFEGVDKTLKAWRGYEAQPALIRI